MIGSAVRPLPSTLVAKTLTSIMVKLRHSGGVCSMWLQILLTQEEAMMVDESQIKPDMESEYVTV